MSFKRNIVARAVQIVARAVQIVARAVQRGSALGAGSR